MKWLLETAKGIPFYPRFARDPFLDKIRQSTPFRQFMTEMRAEHEQLRTEFS